MTDHPEAPTRVLEQLAPAIDRIRAGEPAEEIAADIWPDFKTAIAWAMSELRSDEAEGVRRWRKTAPD